MANIIAWPQCRELVSIGEINTKPSMTIPDMAMGMREILDRYAKGLNPTGTKVPLYQYEEGEEPDWEYPANLERMDISEKMDLIRDVATKVAKMRKQEEETAKKVRIERFKSLVKKEVENEIKQKEIPVKPV